MPDFMDGVPLVWNDDENLFKNLFPQGGNHAFAELGKAGAKSLNYEYASPSADSNFTGRDLEDTLNTFFPKSKRVGKKGPAVFLDPDCECDPDKLLKPIKFDVATYVDGGSGADVPTIMPAFTVVLFVSKYTSKLDEAFRCYTRVGDTEMVLFLEDNRGDMSGTTTHIRVGEGVRVYLRSVEDASAPFVLEMVQQHVPIDSGLLAKLIQSGFAKDETLESSSFLFWVNEAFGLEHKIKAFGSGLAAQGTGMLAEFIDSLKIDKWHWNPKAKAEEGEEEQEFSPLFFPFIEDGNLDETAINRAIVALAEGLRAKNAEIMTFLDKDLGQFELTSKYLQAEFDLIPDGLQVFLRKRYVGLWQTIDEKLTELEKLNLGGMLRSGIRIVNAFLCGLANSFLDALLGYMNLLQLLFLARQRYHEAKGDPVGEMPELLEQLDDFRLAIAEMDFAAIWQSLVDKLSQITWENLKRTEPEVVAYFMGAAWGMIYVALVEAALSIVLTGGTLTVVALLRELFSLVLLLFRGGYKLGKGVVNLTVRVGKKAFKGFQKVFVEFINFFTTENFLKALEEWWEWAKETWKIVEVEMYMSIKTPLLVFPSLIAVAIPFLFKQFARFFTARIRKNLISLGIQVFSTENKYFVYYADELVFSGNKERTGKFLKQTLEATEYNARRNLDDLSELARQRRLAYEEFIIQISRANFDELKEHIFNGHLRTTLIKSGERANQIVPSTKGIHSMELVNDINLRVVPESRIPADAADDEVFQIQVQMRGNEGTWIDKITPSDNIGISTMFPENWDEYRIMEEIAFAYKNRFLENVNQLHKYTAYSTNGIKIEFIIRNGEIKTVYPKFN